MSEHTQLKLLGHLFFLTLLVLSVVFYLERVMLTDSAYYLFKIINYESLNIEYGRFPSIFPQSLVVAGMKLHLPLKWLVLLFSVAFVLVYYMVFLLCTYTFKNVAAGITVALVLVLCVRQSFFHIVTETHQAVVYSCLFFAWIMNGRKWLHTLNVKAIIYLAIGLIIISFSFYSHPVALFMLIFSIAFYVIDAQDYKNAFVYVILLIVAGIALIKYVTTPSGSYEGQFFDQIVRFPELISNYKNLYSKWFYDAHFNKVYIYPYLLLLVTAAYYLFSFRFLKLGLILVAYFGFIIFVNLIFNQGDARIMMERSYMPLAFFAGMPFTYDLAARFKGSRLLKIGLITIFIISITGIVKTSRYFTDRLHYIDQMMQLMDQKGHHKMLLEWDKVTNNLIYVPWAFGVETLLYSTIKTPENPKTIFIHHPDQVKADLSDKDLFLCVHFDQEWDINELNSEYLSLPKERYWVRQDSLLFEGKRKY